MKQRDTFVKEEAGDLFPEYYILRVDEFNRHAVTPLDEWVRFLKSGTIDEGTQVEGLKVAKKVLRVSGLSREERRAYDRHVDAVRVQWDVLNTAREEGLDEGRAEGRREATISNARAMLAGGISSDRVADILKLSENEMNEILKMS